MQEPPVDQGPFGMRVALTFDDGPNTATTPAILETLRARNIPATFFMLGQRLLSPGAAELAREIHADPLFRVANHTYTHARLTDLDLATAQQEVELTSAEIRAALQDPCYFPRYFRFPQGYSSCETMQMVREHGFAVAGVNIDSMDWCYASTGSCPSASFPQIRPEHQSDPIGHALAELAESGGGIMLMHDIHARTRDNLPALLDQMLAAGVTFVSLEDVVTLPLLNAQVQVPEPPACCGGVTR
jgi:peptidoglycan/xylan/chitin deacetylase (PgdA/CDA1 family)